MIVCDYFISFHTYSIFAAYENKEPLLFLVLLDQH